MRDRRRRGFDRQTTTNRVRLDRRSQRARAGERLRGASRFRFPGKRAAQYCEDGADGILGQIHESRAGQELGDAQRQVSRNGMVAQDMMLIHLDLLSQFVADALHALSHRCDIHVGATCEAFHAPASVIVQLADATLFLGESQKGARELPLLLLGPGFFVVVQNRWGSAIRE
jgi:hypothetical protein